MSDRISRAEPNMIPIKLEKRYPHSRDEDITDAFMRGYQSAQAKVVRCKDCDNTVPHWYMLNGKRVDCNWCVEMESEVDDDEYCSRAVPKGTRAKMKGGAE